MSMSWLWVSCSPAALAQLILGRFVFVWLLLLILCRRLAAASCPQNNNRRPKPSPVGNWDLDRGSDTKK